MRPSCDVISDLLPLYVEGLASADTRQLECFQHALSDTIAAMQTLKSSLGPARPLRKLKGRLLGKVVAVPHSSADLHGTAL